MKIPKKPRKTISRSLRAGIKKLGIVQKEPINIVAVRKVEANLFAGKYAGAQKAEVAEMIHKYHFEMIKKYNSSLIELLRPYKIHPELSFEEIKKQLAEKNKHLQNNAALKNIRVLELNIIDSRRALEKLERLKK